MRALALVCAVGSLLSFGGRLGFPFELLAHFPVQYAVVLGLLGLVLFALKDWKVGAAVMIVALVHATRFAGELAIFLPSGDGGSGQAFKIVAFNVNSANERLDEVNGYLKAQLPDVLLITELGPKQDAGLDLAGMGLSLVQKVVREDNFGIGLYARWPATASAIVYPGGVTTPAVDATIKGLRVLGVHPLPPMSREALARRDAQLLAVAKLAAEAQGPVVMLGDFNLTPWGPAFGDVLRVGKLSDTRWLGGGGLQTSWPAGNRILRIPIDHALIGSGIVVRSRSIGPDLGSDHLPVELVVALGDWPKS